MFKITLNEPRRGYDFLLYLIRLGEEHPRLGKFYPIGADVFVLIYPILLITIYCYGMVKAKLQAKKEALFIFVACFFSVLVNIISQQFFDKKRPIYELGIEDFDETLLHNFLPSTSFPSDHAVVTFSVAMATLLIARKNKNKTLGICAIGLFIVAFITVLCRIGTTVHWTTDVLAGCIMGILVPTILIIPKCYTMVDKWLLTPLINFEEYIIGKIFKKYKKSK